MPRRRIASSGISPSLRLKITLSGMRGKMPRREGRIMRIARIGEALGWGIITAAVVISFFFVSSTYGQTLDSEARVYEEDGRLEIEYIQDSDYAYDCTDLFFGTSHRSRGRRLAAVVEVGRRPRDLRRRSLPGHSARVGRGRAGLHLDGAGYARRRKRRGRRSYA